MSSIMWVEKYRPRTVAEVIGNEEAKASFIDWLRKKSRKRAVLLYGPAGVGKTALVHAAANDFKYKVIEMNASDTRTEEAMMKIAGPATSLTSLEKFSLGIKGSLLLLDEVDGVFGREDRGGVSAIMRIVQESRVPVVLTANDPDIERLRPLRRACRLIRLRGVRIPLIVAFLQKICLVENVAAEEEALEMIAQNSQGDVRSAVNDIQTLCEGKRTLRREDAQRIFVRNKGFNVYETLRGMFSAGSAAEAYKVLDGSLMDYDTLLLTIHDNLPLRYRDPEKLATAYDVLSKADVFRGRVGTENWQLLSYVLELLTQSTTIAPKEYQPFNFIFPPTKLTLLKWTRSERTLLEKICAAIGSRCHVSRRFANSEFIPFLKIILGRESEQAAQMAAWLGLDKESIDYLRGKDQQIGADEDEGIE